MSASEKLKALSADAALLAVGLETQLHVAGTPSPAAVVLRDALPQIVAVVEQLERILVPWEKTKGPAAAEQILSPARDALSALDQALSDG